MKKIFIIVLVLALLTIGVTVAIAADSNDDERVEYHEEMLKYKQEQLDELVDEGLITREEADAFIERMEENFESGFCNGPYEDSENDAFHGFGSGFAQGEGYGCGRMFNGN